MSVAVVTGGTGGIGAAIVGRLLAEGMTVISVARSLHEHNDDNLVALQADLSDANSIEAATGEIISTFGAVDVLINNAGTCPAGAITETDLATWNHTIAVNLTSAFLFSKALLPHFRSRPHGSIVNISSIDALIAENSLALYSASKAGLIGLTRGIAADHGKEGLRCNAICPGYIDTEMTQGYLLATPDPDRARAETVDAHPLGRMGTPEDVAALAQWLCSPDAGFVTGQAWVTDGGLTSVLRPLYSTGP